MDYKHFWNKIDPSFVCEKTNEHPCHCHGIKFVSSRKVNLQSNSRMFLGHFQTLFSQPLSYHYLSIPIIHDYLQIITYGVENRPKIEMQSSDCNVRKGVKTFSCFVSYWRFGFSTYLVYNLPTLSTWTNYSVFAY